MLTNRLSTRTIVLLVGAMALIALLMLKAYLGQGRAGMVDLHAPSVGDAIHSDTHSPLLPGQQMALDSVATGVTDLQVLRDLAKVRRATAKYHNVNIAIADGYVPTTACDAVPGVGGMGYHYVNPDLAMDPAVDLLTPEILMYAASGKDLRLVGVEYFQGIGAPDAEVLDPAPPAAVLFGLPLDGPMLGHIPGMPPHYDLHVWIWQPNPDGMFAMWNPKVTCP